MNTSSSLSQSLGKYRMYVSLVLCAHLHKVCANVLYKDLTELDFANFINLRDNRPIEFLPRTKIYICFMIHEVSRTIILKEKRDDWIRDILSRCGIPYGYYKSHHSSATHNEYFIEGIEKIISNVKR